MLLLHLSYFIVFSQALLLNMKSRKRQFCLKILSQKAGLFSVFHMETSSSALGAPCLNQVSAKSDSDNLVSTET